MQQNYWCDVFNHHLQHHRVTNETASKFQTFVAFYFHQQLLLSIVGCFPNYSGFKVNVPVSQCVRAITSKLVLTESLSVTMCQSVLTLGKL